MGMCEVGMCVVAFAFDQASGFSAPRRAMDAQLYQHILAAVNLLHAPGTDHHQRVQAHQVQHEHPPARARAELTLLPVL